MNRIVVLKGDGIGPEVTAEAVRCLEILALERDLDLHFFEHDFGGRAIDRSGDPLPAETLDACRNSDAVLLGAVGGDRWSEAPVGPEAGLLRLRKALGLFANLRPSKMLDGLLGASPLRPEISRGADVLVVRELIGGLYFGKRREEPDRASDLGSYRRCEIERIAHVAFRRARDRRRKVTSVDKANVLATSRLWRRTVDEVAGHYDDVELEHMHVDACAMEVVTRPCRFDVILTGNLFGDILSDELSAVAGSIGLLGSASLSGRGPGLFEPIHGSAPHIAGLDVANPAGAIASAAMMLDELGFEDDAALLSGALNDTLSNGVRTRDIGGTATCSGFGAQVRLNLQAALGRENAFRELIAMNRGCCG